MQMDLDGENNEAKWKNHEWINEMNEWMNVATAAAAAVPRRGND